MDIDPEITTANGFHIENVPTRFVSGFTRWIEEHADLRRPDAAVLIEMCGYLARTEGLDEEALHIVAGLTGAGLGKSQCSNPALFSPGRAGSHRPRRASRRDRPVGVRPRPRRAAAAPRRRPAPPGHGR